MATFVKLVMPMSSRSNGISSCNDWVKGEGVELTNEKERKVSECCLVEERF